MRYLYLACLGLLAHTARGQAVADSLAADSTQYPVAVDTRWVRSEVDSVGICTEILHWSGAGGLVRAFYPSGVLKEYIPYSDLLAGKVHGVATSWYESGQLRARQTLIQGQRDSLLLLYYENGQLKRRTRYVAGTEQLGMCFDSVGRPLPYFPYEQPPLYPGGQTQLIREISRFVTRHRQPVKLLNSGWFTISFQVGEDGAIVAPQVDVSSNLLQFWRLSDPAHRDMLQNTIEHERKLLINSATNALSKLPVRFYPGKRDGVVAQWRYQLAIPFNYEMAGPYPVAPQRPARYGFNW